METVILELRSRCYDPACTLDDGDTKQTASPRVNTDGGGCMGIAISADFPTTTQPRQKRQTMAMRRILVQYWRSDRAVLKLFSPVEPCPCLLAVMLAA